MGFCFVWHFLLFRVFWSSSLSRRAYQVKKKNVMENVKGTYDKYDVCYDSFVRSVTMDKWSDEQIKRMKVNASYKVA
jgi:hypothetical protein